MFRQMVAARSTGRCAVCRLDLRLLARILLAIRRLGGTGRWLRRVLGMPERGTIWQADHIVPLAEGGERHSRNGRVLCVPCHKNATRELAARRAAERRFNSVRDD